MADFGIDIGATHIRVGRIDGSQVVSVERADTPESPDDGVALAVTLVRKLAAGDDVDRIAVGVAGSVSPVGFLFGMGNRRSWDEYDLGRKLSDALSVPVAVQNDAVLGALGEAHFGAGRGKRIVAYLSGGTGVGTCRIVDGEVDANAFGFSAGHVYLGDAEFEDLVAGSGLTKRYGMPPERLPKEVWRELEPSLAVGIYNTMLFWSPDVVVLSGSVFLNQDAYNIDAVRAHTERINTVMKVIPPIVRGTLGDDAGLYGAIAILNKLENKG